MKFAIAATFHIIFSPFIAIFIIIIIIHVVFACEIASLNNIQSLSCGPYGGNIAVHCVFGCLYPYVVWSEPNLCYVGAVHFPKCFNIESVSARCSTADKLLTCGCSACLWKVYSYLADQEIPCGSWFLVSAVCSERRVIESILRAVQSRPSSHISFFKVAFQYKPILTSVLLRLEYIAKLFMENLYSPCMLYVPTIASFYCLMTLHNINWWVQIVSFLITVWNFLQPRVTFSF
jgi:hypothetical protein